MTSIFSSSRYSLENRVSFDDFEDAMTEAIYEDFIKSYSSACEGFNDCHKVSKVRVLSTPGVSRWSVAAAAMLRALEFALRHEYAFLCTLPEEEELSDPETNTKRLLLCKMCSSMSQYSINMCMMEETEAWAEAAIAADPAWHSPYNYKGLVSFYKYDWTEARDIFNFALSLPSYIEESKKGGEFLGFALAVQASNCDKILSGDKAAERDAIKDNKPSRVLVHLEESSLPLEEAHCHFCFFPALKRCSRCLSVYYCSALCQKLDYKEHRLVCVETGQKAKGGPLVNIPTEERDFNEVKYPKPSFPESTLCRPEEFKSFKVRCPLISSGVPLLFACATHCHAPTFKRALLESSVVFPDDYSVNLAYLGQTPLHAAALRNEPENAKEIMEKLLTFGACPNTRRSDGMHTLEILMEEPFWMKDTSPSGPCQMFKAQCRLKHFVGQLRSGERHEVGDAEVLKPVAEAESKELRELVEREIKRHALCKHCTRAEMVLPEKQFLKKKK